MAGSTPIEAGKVVPLSMLIPDRDDTKFVRARIYDDTDTLITTISMPNVGGGLYAVNSYIMPDISYIKAIYDVFDDAGFTLPSEDDGSDLDVFTNDRNQQLLDAIANLLTAIQNVTGSLAQVEADISTPEIEASVSSPEVAGEIGTEEIEASIGEVVLTGEIDDDDLEGNVDC